MGSSASVHRLNSESKCAVEAEVEDPIRRAHGVSIVRKERFIYSWTLKDLNSLDSLLRSGPQFVGKDRPHPHQPSCKIISDKFRAGQTVGKNCEWYLSLGAEDVQDTRCVCLHLVLAEHHHRHHRQSDDHSIPVEFSVTTSFGKHSIEKEFGLTIFKKKDQEDTHGWSNFLRYSETTEEMFAADELLIECGMEIWGNKILDDDDDNDDDDQGPSSTKKICHCSLGGDSMTQTGCKIMKSLYAEYKNGMGDVQIVTSSSSSSFMTHRIILNAHSIFFENELQREEEPKRNIIKIPNIDGLVMTAILDWMYTGQLPIDTNFDLQCKILTHLDKLQLNQLTSHIFNIFIQKLQTNQLSGEQMARTVVVTHDHKLKDGVFKDIFQQLKQTFCRDIVKEKLTSASNFKELLQNSPDAFTDLLFS